MFHTEAHCWQFRLISAGGAVFGERKLYYSPEAALKAGLQSIAQETYGKWLSLKTASLLVTQLTTRYLKFRVIASSKY